MTKPQKSKDPSPSGNNSLSYKALVFMAMLSLQFGIQPIVTQKFMSKKIIMSTVIFTQEVVKLIIGVVGISLGNTRWADVASGWTVMSWLRLSLIPGTIYFVQNMCSLLAYQNLDAITYNVLNQTKTLSAALCCYLLMKRKQSFYQMLALLLLLIAALVMEKVLPIGMLFPSYWVDLGDKSMNSFVLNLSSRHFYRGVLPIMVASFLSGLAGAITQISLQVGNRDALLFTVELCAASILIILVSLLTSADGSQIRERGFFDEWTLSTLVPILTNSAGGILVGLVIKYAGTVPKGFALIFGIALTGMVQSHNEKKALSLEKIGGGVLAAVSLWMHVTNPYVEQKSASLSQATLPTDASNGTSLAVQRGRGRKSRKED